MIVVDDGSTDGTWPVICQLAADDPRILGIRLRRNFGKAAALSAGFHAADGERIVTIDGDLQDNPAEIANLLAKIDEGFDVVSGWKRERHDPWHKVLAVARVQLARELADGRAVARSQLRPEGLSPRGDARDSAVRRAAPVRAGAGGGQGLSHRRSGGQPSAAEVWEIEVRRVAADEGTARPDDREVHRRLRPAAAAHAGHGRVVGVPAGRARHGVAGRGDGFCRVSLDGHEAVDLHETAALYYCLALFIIGAQFLSVGLLGEMIAAYWTRDTDTYSIAEHTAPAGGKQDDDPVCRRRKRYEQRAGSSEHEAGSGRSECSAPAPCSCSRSLGRLSVADRHRRRQHDGPAAVGEFRRQDCSWKLRSYARICERQRKQLIKEGVTGEQLQSRMAVEEARLRDDLRLQRPFLSANDRSRWMTIRSLVERGTYEIDAIVGQPTWDTIDMVQHRGRDGKLHLYSSKPPLLATLAGRRVLADSSVRRRDAARPSVRNWPRDAVDGQHLAAGVDVCFARAAGRAVRHDRLGPDFR